MSARERVEQLERDARLRYHADPLFHARAHLAATVSLYHREHVTQEDLEQARRTAALALLLADMSAEELGSPDQDSDTLRQLMAGPTGEVTWRDVMRLLGLDPQQRPQPQPRDPMDGDGIVRLDADGEWVRATYRVPAHIGSRVRFDGQPGTVVGFSGPHLVLQLDGQPGEHPVHPTWHMDYDQPAEPR